MTSPSTAPIYLDYNATAPVMPQVIQRIVEAQQRFPGNPSSPHQFGQEARAALEEARRGLAAALGFDRREVFFTSGGSESNNQMFSWLADLERPTHLITSPIEHPSVLQNCKWLESKGVAVSYLPVDTQGRVQVEAVGELIRPETRMVSLMAANNETGVLQPLENLVTRVREAEQTLGMGKVLIHTDAVQAFGRVPFPVTQWGVDSVTLAAHKMGGPRGVGLLALRDGWQIPPMIRGGGQERGLRAGTENVALAQGFLAAVETVLEEREATEQRLVGLRDHLMTLLKDEEGFFVNGNDAERLPNTLNCGFEGVPAQALLVAMDMAGVAVSVGSACQSGAIEPSHVLQAMGLSEQRVLSSLRISMGWATTQLEVERCAEVMVAEAQRLRIKGRRHVS